MISVIICCKNKHLDGRLRRNIYDTIGCESEIIAVDNSGGQYGICEAYNLGALKSKFQNLVFVHEDVIFRSAGWGPVLHRLLLNSEIGLAGVTGAVYKSELPTSWISVPTEFYRSNMIQGWKADKRPPEKISFEKVSEVAVLDGVFLAMRKEVWVRFPFDQENLKGFHCYDLDLSLRVGAQFKVVVTHNILIEHFSAGTFSKSWFIESMGLHQRLKDKLPRSVISISDEGLKKIKYVSLIATIENLKKFSVFNGHFLKYIMQLIILKPISWYPVRSLIFLIVHKLNSKHV